MVASRVNVSDAPSPKCFGWVAEEKDRVPTEGTMRERDGAEQESVTEEVSQSELAVQEDPNRSARTAGSEGDKATDVELAILREAAQRQRSTTGLARRILEKLRPKSRALAASKFSFFIAGLLIAVWATMVPYVKVRLGLNEGELGALLLCFGLGSLFSMPVAGVLISEYGARTILRWTTPLTASMLALLAVAQGTVTMVVLLLLFGASYGALNVGASVHAAEVEKRSGKRMMSLIYAAG